MREGELRASAICGVCNEKIGTSGLPFFWRINACRHAVKFDAINRLQGLTMFYQGNPVIASVMSGDEDLTEIILSFEFSVCETCAAEKRFSLLELSALGGGDQ